MKVKNMKAASKRTKLDSDDPLNYKRKDSSNEDSMNENEDDYEDSQQHNDSFDNKSFSSKSRKRCKKFTKSECELLIKLYEKHCSNLDTSSSANSVKKRQDAWEALTEEFNSQQASGITRDCGELKIKIKNIKAMRVKTEPPEDRSIIGTSQLFNDSDASVSKSNEDKKPLQSRAVRTIQIQNNSQPFEDINNIHNFYEDDQEEDDVS
jgi:hypothetical protein